MVAVEAEGQLWSAWTAPARPAWWALYQR